MRKEGIKTKRLMFSVLTMCAVSLFIVESILAAIVMITEGLISNILLMVIGAVFILFFTVILLFLIRKPETLYSTIKSPSIDSLVSRLRICVNPLEKANDTNETVGMVPVKKPDVAPILEAERVKSRMLEDKCEWARRLKTECEVKVLQARLEVAQVRLARILVENFESLSPDLRLKLETELKGVINKGEFETGDIDSNDINKPRVKDRIRV